MPFLLDTPVLLDLLNKERAALALIKEISQQARPAISSLTMTELAEQLPKEIYGKSWQFLQNFMILSVIDRIGFLAGELIVHYDHLKKALSLRDALLAATALTHGHTLVIKNPEKFSFMKGLKLGLYDETNVWLTGRKQRPLIIKAAVETGLPVRPSPSEPRSFGAKKG